MLLNPFTPADIASSPDDFFGRSDELRTLERSLRQGSVAIQGAVGIGKSSLLARTRLLMEGFQSQYRARSVIAVGDKDVRDIDTAARLLLDGFVQVDERQHRVKFKLGSLFETESAEISRYFVEGHHLSILKRVVEEDYLRNLLSSEELLVLAIDEADKCPAPLARLIRSIVTHTQQQGVRRVRFIVAGVSPFFQQMIDEDSGIGRFVYTTITLGPMPPDEAFDLIETKFYEVLRSADERGLKLQIDSNADILDRIVDLSGGHPYLIQLLGSHIVENESEQPDGIIDASDLMNALRRVCYEDRARVYNSTVHLLELSNMLEPFMTLIDSMPRGFPSRIGKGIAQDLIGTEAIRWLADHNILSTQYPEEYGLVDEFLRIRALLDREDVLAQSDLDVYRLMLEEQERIRREDEQDW